ncbi:hypothetical protein EZE40_18475 [Shigella flexneri]|nr:hypothetical protein [Shigella flexneri]EFX1390097.1 hypothetical protein [Shigella flexneri]EFX7021691.1 hypothetical protein [Shigella flexneri]EFY2055617.1 hypothetical protein [Shigella flexneri]
MGSCAAPSAKRDDKFITTDYLQQCQVKSINQYRLTPGFGGFTPVLHVTSVCRLTCADAHYLPCSV